tara:strand:- start:429 stop:1112 length:684 start_codon:yes stop_codon:yes gene_type:complete
MSKINKIFLLFIIFITVSTYSPSQLNSFSYNQKSGFKIRNINIKNNSIIEKSDIIEKLSNIYGKNIFLIKKSDLEKYLEPVDFLDKIEVRKKYPNTLIIKIYETKPIAFLFQEDNRYLLDSSSNLINFKENESKYDLPKVFGNDAEKHFVNFFALLKENNFPRNRIKNYYYFQIGRWDTLLLKGQTIKFPAENIKKAIILSVKLLNNEDFTKYDIIDLRVDGKIIVE